jgi:glycerol dehydrogenase
MAELLIQTPSLYISRPGALQKLGEIVKKLLEGKEQKVLLIWSATAKEKIHHVVYGQLLGRDIAYAETTFTGFPSERQAKEYAALAKKEEASMLLALGGGRTMDVTKAAGTFAELPVFTVPTIAATCAAWAAVSILYTDDGDYDRGFPNRRSPIAILADTQVIAEAPSRYLKAGVADTLAKWYEPTYVDDYTGVIGKYGADLAFQEIREKGVSVIEQAEAGIVDEETQRIVDAIIYLAGFVGSFLGAQVYSGLAHPFYHSARRIPAVRDRLHGEVVSYGLVLQSIYEGVSDQELHDRLALFDSLDNLYDSTQIGFATQAEKRIVVERMLKDFPYLDGDGVAERILAAFPGADAAVAEYRKALGQKGGAHGGQTEEND